MKNTRAFRIQLVVGFIFGLCLLGVAGWGGASVAINMVDLSASTVTCTTATITSATVTTLNGTATNTTLARVSQSVTDCETQGAAISTAQADIVTASAQIALNATCPAAVASLQSNTSQMSTDISTHFAITSQSASDVTSLTAAVGGIANTLNYCRGGIANYVGGAASAAITFSEPVPGTAYVVALTPIGATSTVRPMAIVPGTISNTGFSAVLNVSNDISFSWATLPSTD